MIVNEFDLIQCYFKDKTVIKKNGVALGIGDDCAILDVPDGYQLAVSTDSLVCDVHFFADVDPYRLGYKALAVNLSDLAAMGATPKWVSLALTLPKMDKDWLAEFSRGFFELANQFNVSLVGGDTTKGPLSITVSVKGIIPRGEALQRNQAKVGDFICVSGTLGDGAIGLGCKLNKQPLVDKSHFVDALELTEPRIDLGILLRGLASSCIDVSDGLIQDLKHILRASGCSAQLELDKLPLSCALKNEIECTSLTHHQALQYALTGGDDYELLFTISGKHLHQLQLLRSKEDLSITVIGTTSQQEKKLIELLEHKQPAVFSQQGWDHFQQGKN